MTNKAALKRFFNHLQTPTVLWQNIAVCGVRHVSGSVMNHYVTPGFRNNLSAFLAMLTPLHSSWVATTFSASVLRCLRAPRQQPPFYEQNGVVHHHRYDRHNEKCSDRSRHINNIQRICDVPTEPGAGAN
jgi:hypothetical protein